MTPSKDAPRRDGDAPRDGDGTDGLPDVLESARVAMVRLDGQLRIRSFTSAMAGLLSLGKSDRGRPAAGLVARVRGDGLLTDIRKVQAGRRVPEREVQVRDTGAWVILSLRRCRSPDGTPPGVVITGIDVTKRKQAEDLQRHVINELNHRLRNAVSSARAIVMRTLGNQVDAASVRTLEARLQSLARAHTLLADGEWRGTSLRDLLLQELEPFREPGRESFLLKGPAVRLNPDVSLHLGMVFHELATNASKHGALSNATGCVRVSWSMARKPAAGVLRLRWTETGGPVATYTNGRGFGSVVIERGVEYELRGHVHLDRKPGGLVVSMEIPLSKPARAGGARRAARARPDR